MTIDQSYARTHERLQDLRQREDLPLLDLTDTRRYAILSDIHLGDGGAADDFQPNEETLLHALNHYHHHGYDLILLGDIEEFWQFDLDQIVDEYDATIYEAIRAFGDDHVHRVFGNHDREWGGLVDPIRNGAPSYAHAPEALKFRDASGRVVALLVHGHQGSHTADKNMWFSRFFVRLFKWVEPAARWLHIYSHTSATKSQIPRNYERIFYEWAKQARLLIICGHSHRAIFASRSYAEILRDAITTLKIENLRDPTNTLTVRANMHTIERLEEKLAEEKEKGRDIAPPEPEGVPLPCYFNSGCTLYTDGLTALEIDGGAIRLVKWDNDVTLDERRIIYNEGNLDDIIHRVVG